MHRQRSDRPRRLWPVLLAAIAACLLLGACGSSQNATSLLKQTFSGQHRVDSGNLTFRLTLTPSGSSTLTGPVSLTFSGPFQSLGKGKLPKSDFTVALGTQGRSIGLSIISTGTKGYVSMSGTSYQLPAASYQKLESSFSSITSSGSGGSKSGALARLGINPLGWLSKPSIVGNETIGDTDTTHIRARVNVPALLRDLNTFLAKASSLGVSGAGKIPTSLSAATQQRIAATVRNPSFDVWTGNSDKTVRKLSVGLSLPVTGQVSTLLGGLRTAGLNLTLQYTHLNQPQTITAPSNIQPYSVFAQKLNTLLQAIQSSVAGSGSTGTGSTGSGATGSGSAGGTSTTGGSGVAGATTAYSQCIQAAGTDVSKMQNCASLLNGSGG